MGDNVIFGTRNWKDRPGKPVNKSQEQWDSEASSGFNGLPFRPPILTAAEAPYFVEVSLDWLCGFYWRAKYLKFSAFAGAISFNNTADHWDNTISGDFSLQAFSGVEPNILTASPGFTELSLIHNPATRTPLRRYSNATVFSLGAAPVENSNSGQIAVSGTASVISTPPWVMSSSSGSGSGAPIVSEINVRYKDDKFFAYPVRSILSASAEINGPGDPFMYIELLSSPWLWGAAPWSEDENEFYTTRYAAQSAGTLTVKIQGAEDAIFPLYSARSTQFSVAEEMITSGSISITATVEPYEYWPYAVQAVLPDGTPHPNAGDPIWDTATGEQLLDPVTGFEPEIN